MECHIPLLVLAPPDRLPAGFDALRAATGTAPVPPDAPAHVLPDPREAAYDAYFRVRRSSHRPAELLAAALRETLRAVRARLPEAADEPVFDEVLAALGLTGPPEAAPLTAAPADGPARWLHGHRLFFALIQATTVGVAEALHATGPGTAGREAADRGAASAAVCLRAGTAALRIASDFPATDYEELIRPSMEPPHQPVPGFSGLWSADHRVLIDQLRTWGRSPRAREGSAAGRALRAALEEAYAAHVGVCRRFVGTGPSLLGGSPDAPATLAELGAARRRLLN
ncbi:hypothetical protein [Streptomyces paludis]|uniref:Uncharacterized protein n=1 Tax=Streptomyces paludis TaxID=2282738 RepID=A0A345HWM1_9ACTN|nr:hypothetical protein [Streptomyces paludis]AXG81095.1 hypothetical protein DVK44_29260 [Streptomyces paludis]